MDDHGKPDDQILLEDLTWREQEILTLLAERLTNREIANRLHLAESTVKDYVGKILSKLGVKNRRQAVQQAKRLGLLDQEHQTTTALKTQLPPEPTQFVGRKNELAEIKRLLDESRLLTLVGPGGMGKTRLALKAAERETDNFADGIYFVPLAPISSAKDIVQTIAETLNFPLATHEAPQLQLLRYLQKKQLLLLMDNFEHLMEGAGIISEILQAAPAAKILTTSRERLNLQGETILVIEGLAFPNAPDTENILAYDSISLFLNSARKVRPQFEPTPQELADIIKICQIVGGMPLAIELAAAWLHVVKVEEIAAELEKDLDLLASEVRDVPARHRSIRSVFDHSWSLMDQDEQDIFMRLAVFRGGLTREAAQLIVGASIQSLAGLVNKSFLSHDPDHGRYEIHELLRQYAEDQLEKSPEIIHAAHEAHAAYYAEFMNQRWELLKGSRQMQALKEIESDIENVRSAWRYHLRQQNIPQIWKLIYGLWHFHWIRSWNHAATELFAEAVEAIQDVDDESKSIKALATAFQAYFMAWLGISEQGYELAAENVRILETLNFPKALFHAYYSIIINAYFEGQITQQSEATNKLIEIAAEIDEKWHTSYMLFSPSMVALISGDYAEAQRLAELNLDLYKEMGDVIGSTMPMIILGHVALAGEEYAKAKQLYSRCLKISQQTGFNYSKQTSSKYLAKVALTTGEYGQAEKYLAYCLALTTEVGFIRDVINLLYEYARLMAAQNDIEEAIRLLALVIDHPTSNQTRWLEGRIDDSAKALLEKLKRNLSPETYSAAMDEGRALDLDEVVSSLIG